MYLKTKIYSIKEIQNNKHNGSLELPPIFSQQTNSSSSLAKPLFFSPPPLKKTKTINTPKPNTRSLELLPIFFPAKTVTPTAQPIVVVHGNSHYHSSFIFTLSFYLWLAKLHRMNESNLAIGSTLAVYCFPVDSNRVYIDRPYFFLLQTKIYIKFVVCRAGSITIGYLNRQENGGGEKMNSCRNSTDFTFIIYIF